MEPYLCVCCSRPAVGDIEVSAGLLVGICDEHLARRMQAEARRRREAEQATVAPWQGLNQGAAGVRSGEEDAFTAGGSQAVVAIGE